MIKRKQSFTKDILCNCIGHQINSKQIESYDLVSHNMSFESKQFVKDSNFRQAGLRLISIYRDSKKLLHIFPVPVGEMIAFYI